MSRYHHLNVILSFSFFFSNFAIIHKNDYQKELKNGEDV